MIQVEVRSEWRGGESGYLYSAYLNGERIVHRSDDPSHDAARALQALGLSGPFETVRDGVVCLRFPDLAKAALWRTYDDKKRGLRTVRYKPFSSATISPTAGLED